MQFQLQRQIPGLILWGFISPICWLGVLGWGCCPCKSLGPGQLHLLFLPCGSMADLGCERQAGRGRASGKGWKGKLGLGLEGACAPFFHVRIVSTQPQVTANEPGQGACGGERWVWRGLASAWRTGGRGLGTAADETPPTQEESRLWPETEEVKGIARDPLDPREHYGRGHEVLQSSTPCAACLTSSLVSHLTP